MPRSGEASCSVVDAEPVNVLRTIDDLSENIVEASNTTSVGTSPRIGILVKSVHLGDTDERLQCESSGHP